MQTTLADTELKALIRLLEDPDDGIFRNVSSRLVSFGKNVIPQLESAWESNAQNGIQSRIEDIIQQIEFFACASSLNDWKKAGAKDLLEGSIVASMFQYPEQPIDSMMAKIELLRKDVWLELNDNLTSLEKVRVLNHMMFEYHGFGPFAKFYTTDQPWFIANVLENHKGSPTTMAILYKALADRLDLPIVGIDLPDHFILAYQDVHHHTENDILFYINPFSKGAVFGKGELERHIERMELTCRPEDLRPMSNELIIKRLLTDLKTCYGKLGKYQKLDQVNQLLSIF